MPNFDILAINGPSNTGGAYGGYTPAIDTVAHPDIVVHHWGDNSERTSHLEPLGKYGTIPHANGFDFVGCSPLTECGRYFADYALPSLAPGRKVKLLPSAGAIHLCGEGGANTQTYTVTGVTAGTGGVARVAVGGGGVVAESIIVGGYVRVRGLDGTNITDGFYTASAVSTGSQWVELSGTTLSGTFVPPDPASDANICLLGQSLMATYGGKFIQWRDKLIEILNEAPGYPANGNTLRALMVVMGEYENPSSAIYQAGIEDFATEMRSALTPYGGADVPILWSHIPAGAWRLQNSGVEPTLETFLDRAGTSKDYAVETIADYVDNAACLSTFLPVELGNDNSDPQRIDGSQHPQFVGQRTHNILSFSQESGFFRCYLDSTEGLSVDLDNMQVVTFPGAHPAIIGLHNGASMEAVDHVAKTVDIYIAPLVIDPEEYEGGLTLFAFNDTYGSVPYLHNDTRSARVIGRRGYILLARMTDLPLPPFSVYGGVRAV
jgi:hypothetical protein